MRGLDGALSECRCRGEDFVAFGVWLITRLGECILVALRVSACYFYWRVVWEFFSFCLSFVLVISDVARHLRLSGSVISTPLKTLARTTLLAYKRCDSVTSAGRALVFDRPNFFRSIESHSLTS